jgi:hypothetical protein
MTKLKLLGAAAFLVTAMATPVITPVMAQEAVSESAAYAQSHPYANVYNDGYGYGYGRTGFWPGDVAADVVGGAIGTADAIATAPFRGSDSYAYYGDPGPYAYRHVSRRMTRCGVQPGATYLGPDGRWYPC